MKNKRVNKIIITVLIIQSIAGLIILLFAINLIYDPGSSFNQKLQQNIQAAAANFKPLSIIGDKGDKGDKGDTGADGTSIQGPQGDKGETGTTGASGQSIVGPEGAPGIQGEQGIQGEPGTQGPKAQFRCNPDTLENEYKYPDDEDWSGTGGKCTPIEGGYNGQF